MPMRALTRIGIFTDFLRQFMREVSEGTLPDLLGLAQRAIQSRFEKGV